jgi:hypothetical protein
VTEDGEDGDDADDDTGVVGDDAPFTRCGTCGSIRVSGSAHSCNAERGTSSGRTRAEREGLIERDDGDLSDDVLFLRGRTDSAYHEPRFVFDLDAMLAYERTPPRCRSEPEKREYDRGTREYAQRTGRFPCSYCYPEPHE